MPDKVLREDGEKVLNLQKVQAIDEVSLEYCRDSEVKILTGEKPSIPLVP